MNILFVTLAGVMVIASGAALGQDDVLEPVDPKLPEACIRNPECEQGQFQFEPIGAESETGHDDQGIWPTEPVLDSATPNGSTGNDFELAAPMVMAEPAGSNEIFVDPSVPVGCILNPNCRTHDTLGLVLPEDRSGPVFLGGAVGDLLER